MKLLFTFLVLVNMKLTGFAQYTMRPIEQLINRTEPGWKVVTQWIKSAKNKVEILPVDSIKSKEALYNTQVTSRSIMGAIVLSTGGILIDNGWIRILGAGSSKMHRTLPDWNKGKAFEKFGDRPEFFLVADDAIGGLFAINYGSLGGKFDTMYYFAPDNLEWESMDMNYEDFIWFCLNGNVKLFYNDLKWSTWKKDIQTLKADEVFHIMPPLWSKEGKNIEKSFRKPVPIEEEYLYNLEVAKKMSE